MKLKILLLSLLFVSVGYAQETTSTDSIKGSNVKMRAELGYQQMYRHGNFIVKSPNYGIRSGVSVEFPIKYGIGIETGLKYATAFGKRTQQYAHADSAFFKYSSHQLDIPIRVTYSLPIFWGLKLFAYAGPNINVGLAHKEDVKFTPKKTDLPNPIEGLPVTGTYDLYKTELNRFQLQLGAGGGIQWRNLRLKSGYDWGVTSISKTKGQFQSTRGWNIALEYELDIK